ncbi:MAG TPA: hypothetical protein GX699_08575 [Firmicutes bacterium]|nr:hypothetical protein [Bacillota bacterium]
MKLKLYFGSFRSKDTAKQCIQKLGEAGFLDVAFYQSGETPAQGIDTLSNAYAGELPHYARGTLGSDLAVEGRTNARLYNTEDARKIMGGDTKPDNVYTVVVNITDSKNKEEAAEILHRHGAEVEAKELDPDESNFRQ